MITFPLVEPLYYPVQTAIKFVAVVDGQQVLCFVEVSTLARNFKDFREGYGMEAFESHRSEIESIAEVMIESGYVNPDNELFILNKEFALFRENAVRKSD